MGIPPNLAHCPKLGVEPNSVICFSGNARYHNSRSAVELRFLSWAPKDSSRQSPGWPAAVFFIAPTLLLKQACK